MIPRLRGSQGSGGRYVRRRLVALCALCAALAVGLVAVLGAGGRGGDQRPPRRPPGRAIVVSATRAHTPARRPVALIRLGAIPASRSGIARVYFHGPTAGREVALTFDDGFCAACARRIIDYLLRSGEHATIFPNGRYAASWDPLAKQIRELVARGQLTVGNHTFHHYDPVVEGAAAFGEDLAQNEAWIERTFGLTGRPFFRPPYGAYNASILAEAGDLGYTHVIMWSGTLADSNPRSIAYLLRAVRYWARPGAIILCHANYPPTSQALARIFAILRAKHLRPVTLGQLLGGSPYARPMA